MKHIDALRMYGFSDELKKTAGLATLRDVGKRAAEFGKKHLAGRYGRQVALGAGAGAVTGALAGDENWQQRALQGAALGGAAAGGRILATKAGRKALSEGAKRFGERQLYTLTGKGFKGREIGLEDARKLGIINTPKWEGMKSTPGRLEKLRAKVMGGKARSELGREAQRYAAEVDAFQRGFHNVPGVVHGALTQPGQLVRSGWQRAGTAGKVFAGMGAVEAGRSMAKTPEEGGPGRLESGLRSAGQSLGYLVAPGSMLGQSAVASLAGGAGGAAGKVGDTGHQIHKVRKAMKQAANSPQYSHVPQSGYGSPAYYGGQFAPGEWR